MLNTALGLDASIATVKHTEHMLNQHERMRYVRYLPIVCLALAALSYLLNRNLCNSLKSPHMSEKRGPKANTDILTTLEAREAPSIA